MLEAGLAVLKAWFDRSIVTNEGSPGGNGSPRPDVFVTPNCLARPLTDTSTSDNKVSLLLSNV